MNASLHKISGQNCHWRRRLFHFPLGFQACPSVVESLQLRAHQNDGTRIQLLRDSTHTVGRWRILVRSEFPELREPSRCCLQGSRCNCPILTRRTATTFTVGGPNCCMGREMQPSRRRLCAVCSRLRGRTRKFKFPVVKARSAKKAAKRPPPSGIDRLRSISAKPNWQIGRPRSQWCCSFPTPCSSSPALLGIHSASRKSRQTQLALCFSDWTAMPKCSAFCAPVCHGVYSHGARNEKIGRCDDSSQ